MTDRFSEFRCALCDTSNNVEMAHLRYVKDIRAKSRTGNSNYKQWQGVKKNIKV